MGGFFFLPDGKDDGKDDGQSKLAKPPKPTAPDDVCPTGSDKDPGAGYLRCRYRFVQK